MAQFMYKSLKFIEFMTIKLAGPTLGLQRLEASSGSLVGQLHDRSPQFTRRGGRLCNDFLAREEFLQGFARFASAEALDHLRRVLRRVLAQVVEQLAQQGHSRLFAAVESRAFRRGYFGGDLGIVEQPHDRLADETAAPNSVSGPAGRPCATPEGADRSRRWRRARRLAP